MESYPQSATVSVPAPGGADLKALKRDDVAYQAVTVAAMLLLLGSLWVF